MMSDNEKSQRVYNSSSIYLCAPVNALVEGIFEQNVSFSEVKKHGDFGLGTFDKLDGEMVMLDGIIYQIDGQGQVKVIDDNSVQTPFVCVTFFKPLSAEDLSEIMKYDQFLQWLHTLMPSPNIFYAFKIEGLFNRVKVRSVSKQESLRPLVEIAAEQSIYNFNKVRGIVAGFYTPSFMSSLNVPGLHLHFLSEDRTGGGHLLECEPEQVKVEVQLISRFEMSMPLTLDYLTWDFKRDTEKDLDKVER
jgi:acetolactate decarboxylase